MPRPKNKAELIALSHNNFSKLGDLVNSYSETQQQTDFPPGTLNRNIRDVLGHLHQWHLLFIKWYKEGMQGKKPEMPAVGYTWKTTPDLNAAIQKKFSNTDLNEVRKLLLASFDEIQLIISKHSDEQLFTKKRYKWTGSTSLGAYLVSATSSHYDWAIKLIDRCKR